MEATTINNQVAVINNSIELFRTAPEILKANQERSAKAVSVGKSILDQWHQAWSIEDEDARIAALAAADERSNKYLVNCNTALKEEKEARAAITQMMDLFKKMFTEAEYELDKAKANTVTNKVQNNRDSYAAEVYKIQERKRKETERIAAKNQEAAEIRADFETSIRNQYNDFLLQKKSSFIDSFNAITLESFEEKAEKLKALQPTFKFSPAGPYISKYRHHNDEELHAIAVTLSGQVLPELEANYKAELSMLIEDLIEKLPSKKAELIEQKRIADEAEAARQAELKRQQEAEAKRQAEIAAAKNAAAKKAAEEAAEAARRVEAEKLAALEREAEEKRLAAEREQREREEAEKRRLEVEAEEAKRKSELAVEMKKQESQTMALFDKETMLADTSTAPEARQGFEITVLHPVGYTQVFQLWFEHEGKNLPVDKIGNTKMDQMKSWCEKHAHKTGEKIESKFLRYDESFKAIAKKTK